MVRPHLFCTQIVSALRDNTFRQKALRELRVTGMNSSKILIASLALTLAAAASCQNTSNTRQIFDARQFPRASGYPEDAATGIAASALSFGLLDNGMVEASTRT